MKLSILVILAALLIFVAGFENPAFFFIGYLWTSVLYPTAFATTVLPLSMVFGFACLVGYFSLDKKNKGRPPVTFYLTIFFAMWVTFTTLWATQPDAWDKWNWGIQSIIITIVAPIFLRTRAQIELAFVAVLSAISAHAMTGGIKTILGTGGYDRLGRLMMDNFWLGETSTLALAAVMSLPMAYYAINNSIIFEPYRGIKLRAAFAIYAVLAVMCMVGTSARTGILALGTLLIFGAKGIFRKVLLITSAAAIYFMVQPFLPGRSMDRYGTIGSYQQDSSAVVRLAVWDWAIRYTADHPFGGGFGIFNTNDISFQMRNENGATVTNHRGATAPHSVYFEVLGEQGYPGEILYLSLIGGGVWGTWRLSRAPRGKGEPSWHIAFARVLFVCLMLFIVGASFVGIAFQPLLYLFLGFYCSVHRWVQNQRVAQPKFTAGAEVYRRQPHEAPA